MRNNPENDAPKPKPAALAPAIMTAAICACTAARMIRTPAIRAGVPRPRAWLAVRFRTATTARAAMNITADTTTAPVNGEVMPVATRTREGMSDRLKPPNAQAAMLTGVICAKVGRRWAGT